MGKGGKFVYFRTAYGRPNGGQPHLLPKQDGRHAQRRSTSSSVAVIHAVRPSKRQESS